MKNLRKVLAVMTAAATMCISASAFAAEATGSVTTQVTGDFANVFEYDLAKPAVLTVKAENLNVPFNVKPNTEVTILVLDHTVKTVADEADIDSTEIRYINQTTMPETPAYGGKDIGLLTKDGENNALPQPTAPATPASPAPAAEGDGTSEGGTTTDNSSYQYKVKVGYTNAATDAFAIAEGAIVMTYVPAEDPDTPATRTFHVLWGDLNSDEVVDYKDYMAMVYKSLGKDTKLTIKDTEQATLDIYPGDTLGTASFGTVVWGDLDSSGSIDYKDYMASVYKSLGKDTAITITNTSTTVTTGDAIDVTYTIPTQQ